MTSGWKMLRAYAADAAVVKSCAAKLHMTIPCFINGLINLTPNVTNILRSRIVSKSVNPSTSLLTDQVDETDVNYRPSDGVGNIRRSGIDYWSPLHSDVLARWAQRMGLRSGVRGAAGGFWHRTLNAAMQPIEAGGCGLTVEALYWIIDNLHLDTAFSIDLQKGRVVPLSRILQFRDKLTRDVDPAAPLPRMLDLFAAMAGPAEKTTVMLDDGREVEV